jgi:hypothetical protein
MIRSYRLKSNVYIGHVRSVDRMEPQVLPLQTTLHSFPVNLKAAAVRTGFLRCVGLSFGRRLDKRVDFVALVVNTPNSWKRSQIHAGAFAIVDLRY